MGVDPAILPSADLMRRTIGVDIAYTRSRMRVLENLDGNPIGIAYRQLGKGGWALMARHLPVPSFNRVAGIEPGDESSFESVLRWYYDNSVRPQIEVVPGLADVAMLRELARLGYEPSGFHASLITSLRDYSPPKCDVEVECVRDAATFGEFLDAYVAGWGIPASQHDQFKRNVRSWLKEPGWSLFVGHVGGKPAAEGILYVQDGVAYLADASTDPAFRGRGLHAAMLHARLAAAAAMGGELAFSGAAFLSQSHRNMERAGMKLQFVRSLWTKA